MTNSKKTNRPGTWSQAVTKGWTDMSDVPLSEVLNVNNNSNGFTVGQSANIRLPDPNWGVELDEFMSDDLKNYSNAHLQSLLIDVKEIIPEKFYNQVFIAGGFASYLAGITNEHTDVDLFCVTQEAFVPLSDLINQNSQDFTVRALPRDHPSAFYHKVLKFTYQNINYDLIDSSPFMPWGPGSPAPAWDSLRSLLQLFDLNWAMAGINLLDNTIVCHPSALLTKPLINTVHAERVNATNISRVKKYASRLVREVDAEATQRVITALGFMPEQPHFDLS